MLHALLALATHAAFNLVDNRLLAHARTPGGGLVLGAGSPGFAKYARFGRSLSGWTFGDTVLGRRVSWAASQAVLEVPLHGAEWPSLWLRVYSKGRQSVRVTAGSRTSTAETIRPGWQTVRVPLPVGALKTGENELKLSFGAHGRKAAALEWIQIGGEEPPSDGSTPTIGDAS